MAPFLMENNEKLVDLQDLLQRAHSIMEFLAHRCPLNPLNNISRSEEHLTEYCKVMRDIKNTLESGSIDRITLLEEVARAAREDRRINVEFHAGRARVYDVIQARQRLDYALARLDENNGG